MPVVQEIPCFPGFPWDIIIEYGVPGTDLLFSLVSPGTPLHQISPPEKIKRSGSPSDGRSALCGTVTGAVQLRGKDWPERCREGRVAGPWRF